MFSGPKHLKFKKIWKGKLKKYEYWSIDLKFGVVGLKAAESGMITSIQLEAARQAISRKMQKKGKLWIRVFTYLPITKKPNESRMGKGTGSFSHWAVKVASGAVLFEAFGYQLSTLISAFKTGGAKLPVKTKICF